jgi:hypothetical protein
MSDHLSRRTFIATGTAAGAAVVWGAAHPFADSDIGQTAQAAGTTGPTGGDGNYTTKKKDKLHIKSGHTLHVNKHHVTSVAVSVTGPKALSGKVKLQAISHGKLVGIGTGHFHVGKGGGKRHVKVHVNKAGRHLLSKHKHIPGRITASAHGVTSAHKHVVIKH